MTIQPEDDLRTVAFKACSALSEAGASAVLTGGSAATVYAPEAYQSRNLDFLPSPIAIGSELIREWDTLLQDAMTLHILSPTDCCRDRLAAFLHWNDRSSLAQAVAVALHPGEAEAAIGPPRACGHAHCHRL